MEDILMSNLRAASLPHTQDSRVLVFLCLLSKAVFQKSLAFNVSPPPSTMEAPLTCCAKASVLGGWVAGRGGWRRHLHGRGRFFWRK